MDSKRRVKRFHIVMFVVMVGPVMLLMILTSLAIESNWPEWSVYVLYGSFFLVLPIVSRLMRRDTDSLMSELPIRNSGAAFDPNAPTVSVVEIQRYERARRVVHSRRGQIIQILPLSVILVVLAGSSLLPAKSSLILTYVVMGFAVMGAERALAFTKRRLDQSMHEAHYRPRWWSVFAPATAVFQWLIVIGFLATSTFALTAIFWLGVPVAIGGISGWFLARYAFARFERQVIAVEDSAVS